MKLEFIEFCVCCGSDNITKSPAILMPFVSDRALNIKPLKIDKSFGLKTIPNGTSYQSVNSTLCNECGFLFCDLRFNDTQIKNLYTGYRGRAYNNLRDKYEPGYSKQNSKMKKGISYISEREDFIEKFLRKKSLLNILDWGGNDGKNTPFNNINNNVFLYDPSEIELKIKNKIHRVDKNTVSNYKYDLITCNHVLEHIPFPKDTLKLFSKVLKKNGIVYIEVPCEKIIETSLPLNPDPSKKKYWHEHINFFSEKSLIKLFISSGFDVVDIAISKTYAEGNFDSFWKIVTKLK